MNGEEAKARFRGLQAWLKKTASETAERISEAASEAQAEKVVTATCPSCNAQQDVVVGGGAAGKIRAACSVTGALTLGALGTVTGASIGIASGGAAMPATVPLGVTGTAGGLWIGEKV